MTKTAFNRDGILSNDDRLASASKCLSLLAGHEDKMRQRDAEFVSDMHINISSGYISERQLAWLRDLVEKFAQ